MTGKNVKDRMGPGGMDADRIREIMGEAPACPRKGRGTSGNDIMRPARKSGPMQPSVYGEEYLHGIAGVQRRSLHIPAALHRMINPEMLPQPAALTSMAIRRCSLPSIYAVFHSTDLGAGTRNLLLYSSGAVTFPARTCLS